MYLMATASSSRLGDQSSGGLSITSVVILCSARCVNAMFSINSDGRLVICFIRLGRQEDCNWRVHTLPACTQWVDIPYVYVIVIFVIGMIVHLLSSIVIVLQSGCHVCRFLYLIVVGGMCVQLAGLVLSAMQAAVAREGYLYIGENCYSRPSVVFKRKEVIQCNCERSGLGHCGVACSNHLVRQECNPVHHPAGFGGEGSGMCRNMHFCKPRPKTHVRTLSGKGRGLFASEPIVQGRLVQEYVGEVITLSEMQKRVAGTPGGCRYFMYLTCYDKREELDDPTLILDGAYMGNESRFANHRCYDGSCEVQQWLDQDGRHWIGIFTRRDVQQGEEITYDYTHGGHSALGFQCRCGSMGCVDRVHCGVWTPFGFKNIRIKPPKAQDRA